MTSAASSRVEACPSANQLAAMVDGASADAERASIERHLDDCTKCALLAVELAWVVGDRPPAPAEYHFVRELAPGMFEAIDPAGESAIVELGDVDPALASVHHPAVAEIRGVGDGFIAYEPLTVTLRAWLEGRSVADALAAWTRVLGGLAAIHAAGAVHGRISPDHVFVDGDRVLIAGFARPLGRTSGYLAPELLEGHAPTAKSDQLAACASLYEALARRKPFAGATAGALAVAMATPPAPPAGLDRRRAAAIVRGLAFDPAARWADTAALATALEERVDRRLWWIAAIAIGAIVALGLLVR